MYLLPCVDGSPVLLSEGPAFHCLYYPQTLGIGRMSLATSRALYIGSYHHIAWHTDTTQLSSTELLPQASIVCRQCNAILGSSDEPSGGWRLWKWSIGIASAPPPITPTIHSTQKWISARLLYLIENSGVRKFHVHPPPVPSALTATPDQASTSSPLTPIPSLLVWVFSLDLLFSSSIPSNDRHDPTRSIKIFYQKQTWKPLEPGDVESATIEDVEFPDELFKELGIGLEESQRVLPSLARIFQGWQVGLLDRFDVGDVSSNDGENGQEEEVDVD